MVPLLTGVRGREVCDDERSAQPRGSSPPREVEETHKHHLIQSRSLSCCTEQVFGSPYEFVAEQRALDLTINVFPLPNRMAHICIHFTLMSNMR